MFTVCERKIGHKLWRTFLRRIWPYLISTAPWKNCKKQENHVGWSTWIPLSIHSLSYCLSFWVSHWKLKPIPADHWEAGYNLNRSPAHHRAKDKQPFTPSVNLESLINLTSVCMFPVKWSYLETTDTDMGQTTIWTGNLPAGKRQC